MKELLLKVNRLKKSEKDTVLLDDVSFFLCREEIAGVLGLNDSGILALMDLLTGHTRAEAGEVSYCGKKLEYHNIAEARSCGIYGITQQTSLIARLSVLDNLTVIRPFNVKRVLVDRRALWKQACTVIEEYGVGIDLQKKIFQLTGFERQIVEIYKAILNDAKIICIYGMGENCSQTELDTLKKLLDKIKENGIGIIFIHYNSDKMFQFADRIFIMRQNFLADEVAKCETTSIELYNRMAFPGRINTDKNKGVSRQEKSYILKYNGQEIKIYGGEIIACPINERYGSLTGDNLDIRRVETDKTKRLDGIKYLELAQDRIVCYGKKFWEKCVFDNFTLEENVMLRSYSRNLKWGGRLNGKILRFALKEYCSIYEFDYRQFKKFPRDVSEDLRRQIVMFSWVVNPPEVLILEDPFFAADEELIVNLHCYVNILKKNGTVILCGGNNIPELEKMADRFV